MTEEQKEILLKWLRDTADSLNLRDWTFDIMFDEVIESNHDPSSTMVAGAEVSAIYGRKHATILFPKDFIEVDGPTQKMIVVHELVHLHFNAMRDVIRLDLYELETMSRPTYLALFKNFDRHLELGVDGLATMLAKGFPDIPWSTNDNHSSPTPE